MPSENVLVRQQEKPNHYQYLKSFRVDQCKDFLQHQCSHHKPYTCFNWHFPNQKRRKPVLNTKDGQFNYSPDQYCTKYDESNGVCPDGDSCPFLHRNLGDSERRYHLRYYKVEMCSGELDSHGVCSKNGIHCSFAHNPEDRRQPVYDITEHRIIKGSALSHGGLSQVALEGGDGLSQSIDKNHQQAIDPKWNETSYMLAHYKVELCKTSSRHNMVLCPYYHSAKERRRSIATHKYRAVACAMVKDKDEWIEPSACDAGDTCCYSHTRMELQYHPDVFRTVACTKEQKSGHCNKRIFCAFAHEAAPSPKESNKTEECLLQPPKFVEPVIKPIGAEIMTTTEVSSATSPLPMTLSIAISSSAASKLPSPCSLPMASSNSSSNQNLFTDILGGASVSALAPPFFASSTSQQAATASFSAVVGHPSIATQLKNSLINANPMLTQSVASTSLASDQSHMSPLTTNDHLLDALDDDFVKDVARSPPPGFAKIVPSCEAADMSKLKNEVAELQKQLQLVKRERDQAVKERNQAYNLLDAVKNNPSFDESKFLRCLHGDLELEKLNLSTLFQIQAKLHKDVKLVDQVMHQIISISERCQGCDSKVASVPLICGHKLCPLCYILNSNCPHCGICSISVIH